MERKVVIKKKASYFKDGEVCLSEVQYQSAWDILYGLATSGKIMFPDEIIIKFNYSGIPIQTEEDLIAVCKSFDPHITYEKTGHDSRQFKLCYHNQEESEDETKKDEAEDEVEDVVDLESKSKNNFRIFLSVMIFIFLVILAFAFYQVSPLFGIDFSFDSLKGKSDNHSVVSSSPEIAPVAASSSSLIKKENSKYRLESLIDQGLFSQVVDSLRNVNFKLKEADKQEIKSKLYHLINARAKKLEAKINQMMSQQEYKEAFLLEMKHDKDIFRLVSYSNAKRVRSNVITKWILSYRNRKEAVSYVQSELRTMLGNDCYFVNQNDEGKYFLDFDKKCGGSRG